MGAAAPPGSRRPCRNTQILQRGHVDEAKRFTDIVVQFEGAQQPADFAAPTRAELEAVDRLETIFKSTK